LLDLRFIDNFGNYFYTKVRPSKLPVFNAGNLVLELECPPGQFKTYFDLVPYQNNSPFIYCNCPTNCTPKYLVQPNQSTCIIGKPDSMGNFNLIYELNDSSYNISLSDLPLDADLEINFDAKTILVNYEDWTYKFSSFNLPTLNINDRMSIFWSSSQISPSIRNIRFQDWIHV
jgi:hypothetical protein